MTIQLRSAVLALSLALGGCSAARAQIRPSSPFTPAMARLFDDSVDYVADVGELGGRVASDWEAQIDGLSRASDVIEVAQIETVVQGQDPDGTQSYRLLALAQDVIRGTPPEDNRVALRVSAGQVGFNTVAGKEARLQASRYLLFVKWYTDGAGEVQAHWHLSPATPSMVARVREASGVNAAQAGAERVVRSGRN